TLKFFDAKITLTATGPRVIDLHSTADYDTFQNITIEGPLTVDVDNVGGIGHILCGTWTPTYSHLQRVNLLNWRIRHVRIINAPVTTDNGVTNHRLGIWFTVYQPGAAET